jgi:hypothetical protein
MSLHFLDYDPRTNKPYRSRQSRIGVRARREYRHVWESACKLAPQLAELEVALCCPCESEINHNLPKLVPTALGFAGHFTYGSVPFDFAIYLFRYRRQSVFGCSHACDTLGHELGHCLQHPCVGGEPVPGDERVAEYLMGHRRLDEVELAAETFGCLACRDVPGTDGHWICRQVSGEETDDWAPAVSSIRSH